MRGLFLLLTGFFLLRGSAEMIALPRVSVAQRITIARAQEITDVQLHFSRHPQKRSSRVLFSANILLAALKIHIGDPIPISPKPRLSYNPTTPLLAVVTQPDITSHHQKLADEVLRSLPQNCLSNLERFYVRYDNPTNRGLAGKRSIILDGSVPDEEFKALIIHEFGHITDLGCLQGYSKRTPSSFRDGSETIYEDDPSVSFYQISWTNSKKKKPHSKSKDFVSGYASWDPFEDFAESFAYFVLQKNAFRKRARENPIIAAKLRWMETHVFTENINIATGKHKWNGKVPWDVTKLAYSWHPPQKSVERKAYTQVRVRYMQKIHLNR